MSSDLFAAFGDASSTTRPQSVAEGGTCNSNLDAPKDAITLDYSILSVQPHSAPNDALEDDFGDFEDASAQAPAMPRDTSTQSAPRSSFQAERPKPLFPPKAQKREEPPRGEANAKVGKHPFAGHMDFLFEDGDDEYDAGADDLENLANNPEAAMAYSKKIIAAQEANATKNADLKKTNSFASKESLPDRQAMRSTPKKLTKERPKPSSQPEPTSNPSPARNKLKKKSGYAPARDPEVLFDAENLSEEGEGTEDDWGDFEAGVGSDSRAQVATVESSVALPQIDLLGLDESLTDAAPIRRIRSSSIREADSILGPPKHTPSSSISGITFVGADPWADPEERILNVPAPTPNAASSVSPLPIEDPWAEFDRAASSAPLSSTALNAAEDDAWDDFETAEPISASTPFPDATISSGAGSASKIKAPSESALPPTNIPPPALLLSIYPALFSSAQEDLFTPLSRLDNSRRGQLLSHPATQQYLHKYLNSAIVLAHIVAGRKQRWKRDHILAQSMRIGQAGAGGKSGMKLVGVDKTEVAKEDREVLDAVRLWKGQIGKLRGAVSALKSGTRLASVPDISEQMPIKTLKAVEGGFTAPHACALCGLKREERVSKVDIDVDDSFGEWWVQGLDMHVTCRNWWEDNKKKLQSR